MSYTVGLRMAARRSVLRMTPLSQMRMVPRVSHRWSSNGPSSSAKSSSNGNIDFSRLTRDEIKQLRDMKMAKDRKYKDRTVAYYFGSVAVIFLGLAYAAVPLYRAICARTGFGGVPITDKRKFTDDKLIPVDTGSVLGCHSPVKSLRSFHGSLHLNRERYMCCQERQRWRFTKPRTTVTRISLGWPRTV